MPIPKKKPKEKGSNYVGRLVSFFRDEGYPQKQAVAIALSTARRKGIKVPKRRG